MTDTQQKIKAAAYIRMSTEHQIYSPANQMAAIQEYADRHGFEIAQTYCDEGKSGLTVEGRDELRQMIIDVQSGKFGYKAILVLDCTRWGRFQDADEAAYYEYSCKLGGAQVHYVGEPFNNDGSFLSNIGKLVKRGQAGEYSRELSCKVYAGQVRLILEGYKQGGPAGYGLRRMLIDEHGNQKQILGFKEHKSIATDRVILVPGPEEEIENVRWIYHAFVNENKSESDIANELNRRGILTDLGREWTRSVVREILSNEKYIGNNVFNRMSFKLKVKHTKNPESEWVRKVGAFEGIIDPVIFGTAKGILTARCRRFTEEEMLDKLRRLHAERGTLTAMIINETDGMPSSAAYATRFGGLTRAYQMIGYDPGRDFQYIEINRFLRNLHHDILEKTLAELTELGAHIELNNAGNLLVVNDMFSVSIVICRCNSVNDTRRWKVRFDNGLNPDITIAIRMDALNENVLDYYLLPSLDFKTTDLKILEQNADLLDSYRFENLDLLYNSAKRVSIRDYYYEKRNQAY
jgi:DNA invertase Pin-like site-specific DNA recombinase